MPTISRFFGILIRMYYDDHAPPHFHAQYQETQGVVAIGATSDDVAVTAGNLSARTQRMLLEWAGAHHAELLADWALAREGKELQPIAPLE